MLCTRMKTCPEVWRGHLHPHMQTNNCPQTLRSIWSKASPNPQTYRGMSPSALPTILADVPSAASNIRLWSRCSHSADLWVPTDPRSLNLLSSKVQGPLWKTALGKNRTKFRRKESRKGDMRNSFQLPSDGSVAERSNKTSDWGDHHSAFTVISKTGTLLLVCCECFCFQLDVSWRSHKATPVNLLQRHHLPAQRGRVCVCVCLGKVWSTFNKHHCVLRTFKENVRGPLWPSSFCSRRGFIWKGHMPLLKKERDDMEVVQVKCGEQKGNEATVTGKGKLQRSFPASVRCGQRWFQTCSATTT